MPCPPFFLPSPDLLGTETKQVPIGPTPELPVFSLNYVSQLREVIQVLKMAAGKGKNGGGIAGGYDWAAILRVTLGGEE